MNNMESATPQPMQPEHIHIGETVDEYNQRMETYAAMSGEELANAYVDAKVADSPMTANEIKGFIMDGADQDARADARPFEEARAEYRMHAEEKLDKMLNDKLDYDFYTQNPDEEISDAVPADLTYQIEGKRQFDSMVGSYADEDRDQGMFDAIMDARKPAQDTEQVAPAAAVEPDSPSYFSSAYGNGNTLNQVSAPKTAEKPKDQPADDFEEVIDGDPLTGEDIARLLDLDSEQSNYTPAEDVPKDPHAILEAADEAKRTEAIKNLSRRFGFREDGVVPWVDSKFNTFENRIKIVDAIQENGKDYVVVEVTQADGTKNVSKYMDALQLINKPSFVKSDNRLKRVGARIKAMENRGGASAVDIAAAEADADGAEVRDVIRQEIARAERLKAGKPSLGDRARNLMNKFFPGKKNKQEGAIGNERRGKLAAKLALGVVAVSSVLAVGAAVKEGLMGHDDAYNLVGNFLNPDVATAATLDPNTVSQVADPATGGEAVRAFHDTVRSGDGITQTFIDYAKSHGSDLTPDRAYDFFQTLSPDEIQRISGVEAMNVQGGYGYASGANATVPPEIIEKLNDFLKA